jgi:hypothetical protein
MIFRAELKQRFLNFLSSDGVPTQDPRAHRFFLGAAVIPTLLFTGAFPGQYRRNCHELEARTLKIYRILMFQLFISGLPRFNLNVGSSKFLGDLSGTCRKSVTIKASPIS